MFDKVIVIGCSGSGKSVFSRNLSSITGLPLYHLDLIWHKPDRTTVTEAEFDRELHNILQKDRWIIDGDYGRTLEQRLIACDTVFLFDLPLDVCLEGARSRVGKPHPDLPWTENEFDSQFEQWIKAFPARKLPVIYEMLEKYSDRESVVFRSRDEADKFLSDLREKEKKCRT